jgi:V/A-type H+-transporting ATPase subunit A
VASFYERAGVVKFHDGSIGSLTIGGTVSPAGGNFEEPVTQSTLKVVGAFHGLSRDRANARKFPSIDPLTSWSKYKSFIEDALIDTAREILFNGEEVRQMMKVVGEEGTSIDDFVIYLKAEFLDAVYLMQNGFDPVDAATSAERQQYVFTKVVEVLRKNFTFDHKEEARNYFYKLRHSFIDWNYKEWNSGEFRQEEERIDNLLSKPVHEVSPHPSLEQAKKG